MPIAFTPQFDLLIKNGKIVNGTGNPWFYGDIGITDGRITYAGCSLPSDDARAIIQANGFVVCPGFIDIHTHSDLTLLVNPRAESVVRQGITTEVVGNCGMGIAPVNDKSLDLLKSLLPFGAFDVDFNWHSFGEYLDRLQSEGISHNVAALVAHGPIRTAVMGWDSRHPTPEEMQQMKHLLDSALAEGAVGISTGLEYAPGINADTNELIELSKVAASRMSMYVSHIRNRDLRVLDAAREAIYIGQQANVRVHISHHGSRFPGHGQTKEMLDMVAKARDGGQQITLDMCVPWLRDGWDWGVSPLTSMLPPWAFDGGPGKLIERLEDPQSRALFKMYPNPQYKMMRLNLWDRIILGACKSYPQYVMKNFNEIAQLMGVDDPYDAAFDIMLAEEDGLGSIMILGAIYREQDSVAMMRNPEAAVTTDAFAVAPDGPLSEISFGMYGNLPRFFAYYVRDNHLLSIEEAVRKATSLPAQIIGIHDRGLLVKGMKADITIFELDKLNDPATFEQPAVYPEGIRWVIVNGKVVVEEGKQFDVLPGQVIRAGRI